MNWLARLKREEPASACNPKPEPLETLQRPTPPAVQPPALVQPPAPAPPAKPCKLKFLEWADAWRELDRAYQRHHFTCPACIAAGKGYGLRCGAGAALYRAYEDASSDRSGLDW